MKHYSWQRERRPAGPPVPRPVESFNGPLMTRYGGAGLLRRFVEKLRIRKRLSRVAMAWRGRQYEAADYLCGLLAGLLLGLGRQTEVAALGQDPGALMALGLRGMPSQASLSRFLQACGPRSAAQLRRLNRRLVQQLRHGYGGVTIDLDGQQVSTRGHPQGATYGHNRKRNDSKSYFVLMGFVGETRDIVEAQLCPGRYQTISARAAIRTYRRSCAALPSALRGHRLRADAGFYSHQFLSHLEAEGVTYFGAVRSNQRLVRQIGGLSFRGLDDKWAIAELWYRGQAWQQPRRMVVIRERLEETESCPQQGVLLDCPRYAYQVIVTNAPWRPEQVWHFYNQRSCTENIIKESQDDFAGDHILSHTYGGNAVWLALSVLAHNLINWFREKVLNQRAHRHTAQWLRRALIEIPAKVVRSARRYQLKMWRHHPSRGLFELALERLAVFRL